MKKRSREDLLHSLKSIMTKEEFEPIEDKIHKYLNIYSGNINFQTFSFTTNQGRIESIRFYAKKLSDYKILDDGVSDVYVEMTFDKYDDVVSIRHFINGEFVTELCRAVIDAVNQNC